MLLLVGILCFIGLGMGQTILDDSNHDGSLEGVIGWEKLKKEMEGADFGAFRRVMEQADAGVMSSQYMAGLLTLYGADGVRRDAKQSHDWFLKAALQGHTDAQCNLGLMFLRGIGVSKNVGSAARWLGEGAKHGNANAQWMFGRMYYDGLWGAKPTGRPDFITAFTLFEQSAKQNNLKGTFYLGICYEYGLGARQNYLKAAELYKKAASVDKEAGYYYGVMLLYGRGVRQDIKQATRYIREAALAGIAPAMNTLGKLFTHGQGVERDYRVALAWFEKAAKFADKESPLELEATKARDELDRLLKQADAQMLNDVKQYYL